MWCGVVPGDGGLLTFDHLSGVEDVNGILIDCLFYKDDTLFSKALALLNRDFRQRAKLKSATMAVIMLQTDEVPIFKDMDTLLSDLRYLLFLVRSTEVWGVKSKVAGEEFDHDKEAKCLSTFSKLQEYLFTPHGAHVSSHAALTAPVTEAGLQQELEEKEEKEEWSTENPLSSKHSSKVPITLHQNVLRAANLSRALLAALRIDYNISFKGSKCSSDDKVTSRAMLVQTLRSAVGVSHIATPSHSKPPRFILHVLYFILRSSALA